MAILRGRTEARILLIEAPPRHGKSEFISRYFPAWYLGRNPENRVMLTSYEANFARSWGRKARNVLEEFGDDWFGVHVSRDQMSAIDWETNKGGGMVTAGVGGALTGRGANLLIVDDPIKNAEEAASETIREKQWDWWQSTAVTRIEPGGVAVVMATRWHKDDLTGRLLEQAESGDGEPVVQLRLPAIAGADDQLGRGAGEPLWPERWPIESLERRKAASDIYWWNALYQQQPSKHGRTEWPASYFGEHLWTDDIGTDFTLSAIAIDPSKGRSKGDFAAIAHVGLKGGLIYCDIWMDRKPVHGIVTAGIEMNSLYEPDVVGLESNAWQDLLAPEFDRQCHELRIPPLPIHLIHNKVNKEVRIGRIGAYLARKQLRFTSRSRSTVKQLEEFPLGAYDDGPDALEMAIRLLARLASASNRGGGVTFEAMPMP